MISFVIPTLNEEKALEETLQILSAYTGPHEIIVSDGGSNDRTLEIARRYANKVIEHSGPRRQTIAEGRNNGAFAAQGDFIVQLDADTHVPEIDYFFADFLKRFEENPDIVGVTTWFRVYPKDETFMDRLIFGITGTISLVLNNFFRSACTSGGEFQMVRSDAFRAIGGYDETMVAMEDNEMFVRLRKLGRIYFANHLRIYHSGRRAHILGWPHMLRVAISNILSLALRSKVVSKVWEVVR